MVICIYLVERDFLFILIIFGLKTDKIVYILDNDPEKEDKKVYGTNFIVKNPRIIKDKP